MDSLDFSRILAVQIAAQVHGDYGVKNLPTWFDRVQLQQRLGYTVNALYFIANDGFRTALKERAELALGLTVETMFRSSTRYGRYLPGFLVRYWCRKLHKINIAIDGSYIESEGIAYTYRTNDDPLSGPEYEIILFFELLEHWNEFKEFYRDQLEYLMRLRDLLLPERPPLLWAVVNKLDDPLQDLGAHRYRSYNRHIAEASLGIRTLNAYEVLNSIVVANAYETMGLTLNTIIKKPELIAIPTYG